MTEITLTGGDRLCVAGDPREVEATILAAARGSIMELAWFLDGDTGQRVGVNPEHVIMLRELASEAESEGEAAPGSAPPGS